MILIRHFFNCRSQGVIEFLIIAYIRLVLKATKANLIFFFHLGEENSQFFSFVLQVINKKYSNTVLISNFFFEIFYKAKLKSFYFSNM